MTKKQHKILNLLRQAWPYMLVFVALFGLVYAGSKNKTASNDNNLSLSSIASNNYSVSADQVSEFYIVAELADSMSLSSVNDIVNNYVSVSVLQQDGQSIDSSSSGKIIKPITVDVSSVSRGVISYTVTAKDSMASIASKYGISTDQIRWSNNLKTTDVSEGQSLLIPSVPGIVYTVRGGDTVEELSKKYNSPAADIISANDLEQDQTLKAGTAIILPSGVVPETERPEYVAPKPKPTPQTPSYSYGYSYANSATRINVHVVERWTYGRSMMGDGNKMTPGQCTWYAWYWRKYFSNRPLPSASLGNANAWASSLSRYGFVVNRTPSVGAVFQTPAGYYGHVGIVTAINGDGSLTVREMNYLYRSYVVTEGVIPASAVGSFNYIH